MNKIEKVAFVGLGVMGFPMAKHLAVDGYMTKVFNRTHSKAERWEDEVLGTACTSPKHAAQDSQIVFVCVGNDEDVRSVIYGGDGVLAGMKKGSILVDHTTTSAELAEELSQECRVRGIHFIDAPVSGGQVGAENGELTIMCGGDEGIFNQLLPVIGSYAKKAVLMGSNGQGQRCKMVNQICIAGVLKGLSEGLLLAEKVGLDAQNLVDVLKHGAAGSWQMSNRAVTMSQDKFDFGFAIDWMKKDLGICIDEGQKLGLDLPLTKAVDLEYQTLRERGLGRMDTSALLKIYKPQQ